MKFRVVIAFFISLFVLNLSPVDLFNVQIKNKNIFFQENKACYNVFKLLAGMDNCNILLAGEKIDNSDVSKRKNVNKHEDKEIEKPSGKDILIKVTLVVLLIWFVLGIYLFTIDRRIAKLEKMIDEL